MVRKGVPRAPHKEGCMCAVCKAGRAKLEATSPVEPEVVAEPAIVAPPPPPTEVRLDSLPIAAKFEYKGEQHSVREHIPGLVVCYNLFTNDTVTLAGFTMVKPIK